MSTWYTVRTASGDKHFALRQDAENYANTLAEDWKLLKLELASRSDDPHDAPIRSWVIGGSATLKDPPGEADTPWSARSGEQESRSGTQA